MSKPDLAPIRLERACLAFTGTDLMVGLAVVSVLVAIGIVPVTTIRKQARLTLCSENLHRITGAVLAESTDHNKALPGAIPGTPGDLWWWYKEQIKPYLGASSANEHLFACPGDRGYSDPKPFHQTARFDYGSYVYNGVTMPGVPNIAGWELGSITDPRRTLLVMEWTAHAPLSWHNSKTGIRNAPFYSNAQSVAGFVDGHVKFTKIYYDGYTAAFLRDPIPGYDYRYSGK